MAERIRADRLLVEEGHAPSRDKAREAIIAGRVRVNGRPITKPATLVDRGVFVEMLPADQYVSRGAVKLEKALTDFAIEAKGERCLDAGASTGGFTDLLLRRGAQAVVAVDVGYGQLAWKLRQDPRVTVFERTNIRSVTQESIGGQVDLITADLSFISLAKVMGVLSDLVRPGGRMVCLVKPQFEVGKGKVGRRGVVREAEAHRAVLCSVGEVAQEHGLGVRGTTYSPVVGPEGNIEFFLYAVKGEPSREGWEKQATQTVAEAHRELVGAG